MSYHPENGYGLTEAQVAALDQMESSLGPRFALDAVEGHPVRGKKLAMTVAIGLLLLLVQVLIVLYVILLLKASLHLVPFPTPFR